MIKAEFRVILRDTKEVKQWRDSEVENDEWKDMSTEDVGHPKAKKLCEKTTDMFDEGKI